MPTLEFKGKQFVYSHHHSVPFRELVIDKDKSLSKKPNLDDNLIIHGDNLHALKALMPQYAGKIKCIYIDPPYNTGNEGWCYNDNVNSPLMKEWVAKNANPVDKEDLQRHDKWLCMMYPRLKLLHELLADDGVIFVSIDDHEQHHLRAIMDEIFGEENFVANIVWQKKYAASNDVKGIAAIHDFIICYQKTSSFIRNLLPRTDKQDKLYKNNDFDGKGLWRTDNLLVKSFSESGVFPIVNPKTGKEFMPSKGSCWRASRETIGKWLAENKIFFGKDGKGAPQLKRYLNEVQQGIVPTTWWTFEEVGHNDAANKELTSIFDEKKIFDTPKPSILIKRILEIATNKNSIILDSFAGSGTTAHAVLDLNKEDGGNRKFILVEMEKYADDITAERVRRVIKGVPTAKDEKLRQGLGGSFTFCKLGDEFNIEKILTGETLPKYEALARYVFYTATGKSLEGLIKQTPDYFIGETDLYQIYLIYKPDIAFLRSNESALNAKMVEAVATKNSKKQKLVFASAKYMGQNELNAHHISFCQLPYAIHKVVGK